MKKSAHCPRCHCVFSLAGRGHRTIYCSPRCRHYMRNLRYYARHPQQRQAWNRLYMRRRRKEKKIVTSLPVVDTACLPVDTDSKLSA